MPHCMVSSLVQSLQTNSVVEKLRFAKMISIKLMVCYLVRLKYCYLGPSKNNRMVKHNLVKRRSIAIIYIVIRLILT